MLPKKSKTVQMNSEAKRFREMIVEAACQLMASGEVDRSASLMTSAQLCPLGPASLAEEPTSIHEPVRPMLRVLRQLAAKAQQQPAQLVSRQTQTTPEPLSPLLVSAGYSPTAGRYFPATGGCIPSPERMDSPAIIRNTPPASPDPSIGDDGVGRQVALVIQQEMKLDRPLGLHESCPVE